MWFRKKPVKDRDGALYVSDIRLYQTSTAMESYLEEVFKVSGRHLFHLGSVHRKLSDGSWAKCWYLSISGESDQCEARKAG
jgi:hypothetical protein